MPQPGVSRTGPGPAAPTWVAHVHGARLHRAAVHGVRRHRHHRGAGHRSPSPTRPWSPCPGRDRRHRPVVADARPRPPRPTASGPPINAWAAAYTSGDPGSLLQVTGDPDTSHSYMPLTGVKFTSVDASQAAEVWGDAKPKAGADAPPAMVVRVDVDLYWLERGETAAPADLSDEQVSPASFDVLVERTDTASPVVVAWGAAGSGELLTPSPERDRGPQRSSPRRPSRRPPAEHRPGGLHQPARHPAHPDTCPSVAPSVGQRERRQLMARRNRTKPVAKAWYDAMTGRPALADDDAVQPGRRSPDRGEPELPGRHRQRLALQEAPAVADGRRPRRRRDGTIRRPAGRRVRGPVRARPAASAAAVSPKPATASSTSWKSTSPAGSARRPGTRCTTSCWSRSATRPSSGGWSCSASGSCPPSTCPAASAPPCAATWSP